MLASFDTHLFWTALSSGPYWRGALTALELTAVSLATAIAIGFFVALGALSKRRRTRSLAWIYNWLFRATPTLLQLYFVWYALPQIWSGFAGSWFTPFGAAWIALSLNEAAYMSEIIRAGLLSVDPGQELAGRALGMTRRQILRRVVVPQAVRIVIPPTGNEFITLLKLTSLAFVISLHELLTAAQTLATSTFQYPEPLLASLLYYLVIVSILMAIQSRLERRFTWTSRRRGRVAAPAVPAVSHDAR
ncbi:MAG: polar amino acid transport system permease protein [Actinomycetota bacterium]